MALRLSGSKDRSDAIDDSEGSRCNTQGHEPQYHRHQVGALKMHDSGPSTVDLLGAAGGRLLRSSRRHDQELRLRDGTQCEPYLRDSYGAIIQQKAYLGMLPCRTTASPVVGSRCASMRPSAVLIAPPGQRMSYCRELSSGRCAATYHF